MVFSFGGIPLIWMGDELGLGDDPAGAADPAHAAGNRWRHRPPMDRAAAARRTDPSTVEGQGVRPAAGAGDGRPVQLALRSGGDTVVLEPDDPHVLAYRRRHQRSAPLLALANFADGWRSVDLGLVTAAGLADPVHAYFIWGRLDLGEGRLHLPPWGFAGLTSR